MGDVYGEEEIYVESENFRWYANMTMCEQRSRERDRHDRQRRISKPPPKEDMEEWAHTIFMQVSHQEEISKELLPLNLKEEWWAHCDFSEKESRDDYAGGLDTGKWMLEVEWENVNAAFVALMKYYAPVENSGGVSAKISAAKKKEIFPEGKLFVYYPQMQWEPPTKSEMNSQAKILTDIMWPWMKGDWASWKTNEDTYEQRGPSHYFRVRDHMYYKCDRCRMRVGTNRKESPPTLGTGTNMGNVWCPQCAVLCERVCGVL